MITKTTLKKGDMIIVENTFGNYPSTEGVVSEVIRIQNGQAVIKAVNGEYGGNYTITTAFKWSLADRKGQAKYLKLKAITMKKELKEILQDIDHLEKYDSEEEFVASKIHKLLKAKGVKAMAEVLKELKQSNIL